MTAEEVAMKTLVFQVFDWDLITGDDDIGEVLILSPPHNHSTFTTLASQVRIPLVNVDIQNGTDRWIEIEKLTHVEGQ